MKNKIKLMLFVLSSTLFPQIVGATKYLVCGDDRQIPYVIAEIFSIIIIIVKIFIPIILVIMGMISFMKVVSSSNSDDDMKKAQKKLINNVIAAIVIFSVMSIISFVVGLVAGKDNSALACAKCMIRPDKCDVTETSDDKIEPGFIIEPDNSDITTNNNGGNSTNQSSNNQSSNTQNTNNAQSSTVGEGNIEMHFMVSGNDDDAILIRTNKYTIMIDGGRYEAKKNIIPYLKDLGVTQIDLLIGSHVHWNHIQSHAAIIENFKVSKAIYSLDIFNCLKNKTCDSKDIKYVLDSLKKNNIPTEMKAPGDYIELGDMKLYFIGPLYPNRYHNANSFIFILKYKNTSYMFTGDTESRDMDADKLQENASKFGLNIDIDVLKWPHHGYNELSDSFFAATTPKYAIIPTSNGCSSKYPSSNDKKLMQKYGVTYYQRCDYKNIVLISDGNKIEIRTNQNASDYKGNTNNNVINENSNIVENNSTSVEDYTNQDETQTEVISDDNVIVDSDSGNTTNTSQSKTKKECCSIAHGKYQGGKCKSNVEKHTVNFNAYNACTSKKSNTDDNYKTACCTLANGRFSNGSCESYTVKYNASAYNACIK